MRRRSLEIVGCFETLKLLRRRVILGDLAREDNVSYGAGNTVYVIT